MPFITTTLQNAAILNIIRSVTIFFIIYLKRNRKYSEHSVRYVNITLLNIFFYNCLTEKSCKSFLQVAQTVKLAEKYWLQEHREFRMVTMYFSWNSGNPDLVTLNRARIKENYFICGILVSIVRKYSSNHPYW